MFKCNTYLVNTYIQISISRCTILYKKLYFIMRKYFEVTYYLYYKMKRNYVEYCTCIF